MKDLETSILISSNVTYWVSMGFVTILSRGCISGY